MAVNCENTLETTAYVSCLGDLSLAAHYATPNGRRRVPVVVLKDWARGQTPTGVAGAADAGTVWENCLVLLYGKFSTVDFVQTKRRPWLAEMKRKEITDIENGTYVRLWRKFFL